MMTFLNILVGTIFSCGHWVLYMFAVPRILHMMQLENYNNKDYMRWLGKNLKKTFSPGIKQLIINLIVYASILIFNFSVVKFNWISLPKNFLEYELYAMFISLYITNILQIMKDKKERKNAKKKLVYTSRAKRLITWNFILMILLEASFEPGMYLNTYMFYSVMIALIPFNIVIANWLAWPTEKTIIDHYISLAKWKLRKKAYKKLIKIGITGSYGKTSTKFILQTILSEKYNVLASPQSYNTTMGNVKVIREMLKPEHEVLIAEMGARYKGDILEICDFVKPHIGIITSIGPQHLESFNSIDNVKKAKAELIKSLDLEGVTVLPKDNVQCRDLYNNDTHKKYCYSMEDKSADVYASNIVLDNNGSSFVAHTKIGNINCKTVLLGKHNIENILGAITIAIELGLSVEQIEAGVSKITPIEHRLQIVSTSPSIVIDDAFNSNPSGAKMAIDVLAKFDGRKIVITPGMVELGIKEEEENEKFGKYMADTIDIAILVGIKRSEPIVKGLRKGKFKDSNIFVVRSLDEASKKLAEITKPGDVILFENDLPDNYDE